MALESVGLAAQSLAVYAAVAASPGANSFAVGAQAALRGLRATLPLCAGIGAGVALAASGACTGMSAFGGDDPRAQLLGRCVAASALLFLAIRFVAPARRAPRAFPSFLGAFGLGLLTAGTNPVTWVYFATACAGRAGQEAALLVSGGAGVIALLNAMLLAALLARPAARDWAERHQRGLRLGAGGLLGVYAGWSVAPLLFG